ncbi:MAG: VWA domain-containing protein [archaeon]
MEASFLNPEYLWLLLGVPVLIVTHIFVLKHLKTRAWAFANYEAIMRVTGGVPTVKNVTAVSKNLFLLVFQIIVFVCLIFSVAGTTLWYWGSGSPKDYVLAIDASSSMLADDFAPNRLIAAKTAAQAFAESIPRGTSVGVISFAGTSFIELPMTETRAKAYEKIGGINIRYVGGTDLTEAIVTATNMFEDTERSRQVVLLTDGRGTVGDPVEEAIKYAIEKNVVVNTVGIATDVGGTYIRDNLVSTIDEATLGTIASETGGAFYRAQNTDELALAYDEIGRTTKEKIPIRLQLPLLTAAIILIFVEWGLINTRYRTLP